jgi:cystathionine beta-lyase family protein involved in aluminum resistance
MTFLEVVAEWVRRRGYAVERVTSVTGYGTDWQGGDTDHWFESVFSTDIAWVSPDGHAGSFTAEGEDMEALWKHVVGAWPTEDR